MPAGMLLALTGMLLELLGMLLVRKPVDDAKPLERMGKVPLLNGGRPGPMGTVGLGLGLGGAAV